MAWGNGDPDRLRGRALMVIRNRVLLRDRYQCQPCKRKGQAAPPDPSNQIDHIVPRSKGGSDRDDNLETICKDCHRDKTIRESGHVPKVEIDVNGYPRSGW
jgi:5-methylcytosine-specific restriction protein A